MEEKDLKLEGKAEQPKESEQVKAARKELEKLNRPVVMHDFDMKFAPRELDVRQLSQKGWRQMVQKHLVVMGARLQNIDSSLIDIQRLLMLAIKKQLNVSVSEMMKELDTLDDEITDIVDKYKNTKLN